MSQLRQIIASVATVVNGVDGLSRLAFDRIFATAYPGILDLAKHASRRSRTPPEDLGELANSLYFALVNRWWPEGSSHIRWFEGGKLEFDDYFVSILYNEMRYMYCRKPRELCTMHDDVSDSFGKPVISYFELTDALDALNGLEKEIITFVYIQDGRVADFGKIYGFSLASAYRLLRSALKSLKQALQLDDLNNHRQLKKRASRKRPLTRHAKLANESADIECVNETSRHFWHCSY